MKNSILPNHVFSYYPVSADSSKPASISNALTEGSVAQIESGSSSPRIPQRHSRQIELLARMPSHAKSQKESLVESGSTPRAGASQTNNVDKYRKASINQSSLRETY